MTSTSSDDEKQRIEHVIIDPIRQLIGPYQGGRIRVWFYTVSHRQLHLRISHEEFCGTDCVFLVCSACTHLCGPFDWDRCALKLEYQQTPHQYVVTDSQAGFTLTCHLMTAVRGDDPNFREGHHW